MAGYCLYNRAESAEAFLGGRTMLEKSGCEIRSHLDGRVYSFVLDFA
jgi:hypothetical protein